MQKQSHSSRYFIREVGAMWLKTHGLTTRNFWNLATWGSVLGFIATVVALIWIDGWGRERYLSLAACVVFFIIFVASILKSAYDVWQRDTVKLDLIEEQKRNPSQFLYPRLSRVAPNNSNEVVISVQWFNGTVFTIEFQTASGSAMMNGMELGQLVPFVGKQRCDAGRSCTCNLYLKPDADHIKTLNQFRSERKALDWSMNLEWAVLVVDTNMSTTVQGPSDNKRIVPGVEL